MAGINAAQKLKGEKPLVLSRNEAYTGVLIDDLVTMGTQEPYRMFTSRAEYRLNLRHDSCDQRLTQKGYAVGLQKQENLERLQAKLERMETVKELLAKRRMGEKSALQTLKMPEITIADLEAQMPELSSFEQPILYQVELDVKYEGYINRQERQINRFEKLESLVIDALMDYDAVEGLSAEGREKLKKIRPLSVGQASRINGVRNSDIAVLILHLDRGGRHGK
jgi:tRNA uridine 5-carboxymethylaminomethyl modification enzyme